MQTTKLFYETLLSHWSTPRMKAQRFLRHSLLALCAISLQGCNAATATSSQPPAPAPQNEHSSGGYSASPTLWGFTPFPYDFTQEAVDKAYEIVDKHGTVFAIHRDDGIPWQEAYDDTAFPKKVQKNWDEHARNLPRNKKVYLGLAPLSTDRKSLAAISEGSKTSSSFLRKNLDSREVKQAYLNYVRRAVKTFNPDYLNIGIEVGELADRSKSRWEDFETLFEHVRSNIKNENPGIQIGISFGLDSLMESKVAQRARSVIASSDYIGISFYPYISSHKNDASSRPPQQWLEPLNWLSEYADKPIAITETGYATKDATLRSPRLRMKGNEQLQKEFLTDLAAIAGRDNYLFVVWFLSIDYEALSRQAGFAEGDAAKLWENIGLFGANLQPKPAWNTWQQILRGEIDAAVAHTSPAVTRPAAAPVAPAVSAGRVGFGFSSKAQLFEGSKNDRISLSNQAPKGASTSLEWSYKYKKSRFQWASKSISPGALSGTGMELWTKAKQDTYVLVSFEEKSGESFFTVLPVNRDWNQTSVSFDDLQRDEKKKKEDGRFQPEKVVNVTIADARGFEGASGDQTVWLSNWQIATSLGGSIPAGATASRTRFRFGFDNGSQVFEGSKNDKLSLSNQVPGQLSGASAKSQQWNYNYKKGRFQWAYKAVAPGAMEGGSEMELWTKAKQSTYVLVSFEEQSGESFYTVLDVSDDWNASTVSFSDLQRDEKKTKEDGRFQPGKVVSVTIADARAMDGARGDQSVWFANWQVR
ncbi:MAG: hypothetical protein AB8G18_02680 [Gammaproteobacteria bacterium]